jgi:predicted transcriptional regulator
LGVRVLFWKLACNRAYGDNVQRWYHARKRTKALLQNLIITCSTAAIVEKFKEEMAKWKHYSKAETKEDRKTFLQKKATAIAEEKNKMMEKILKQLRLRDGQKRSETQIKIVWDKLQSGGVSRVVYLDENGVLHESTDREHLEELCNNANKAKLQKTVETPFTTGAL